MSLLMIEPKHSGDPIIEETEPRAERPKRSNSWESKNAIVYDALNQTLSKDKRVNIDQKEHTKVTIPKRAKSPLVQDRVRLSVSYGSSSTKLFLADIKLHNLGLWVAIQRYWGNIDEIWVKGIPSASYKINSVNE